MLTQTLFRRAFYALALTGLLNWISCSLDLYWTVWWSDIVVHIFGGLSVALAVFWFYSRKRDLKSFSSPRLLFLALISSFIVGVLWEMYEICFGITSLSGGFIYFVNTGSDLLSDIVGGAFGFLYLQNVLKKYE